jgi:hypothetical protein
MLIGASRKPGSKTRLMPAKRPSAMNTIRLLALLNTSGVRELDAGRQLQARRGEIRRTLDERLQLGLAFARHGELGAHLLPGVPQRRVDVGGQRVQLGRELELDQGVFVPLRLGQPRPRK